MTILIDKNNNQVEPAIRRNRPTVGYLVVMILMAIGGIQPSGAEDRLFLLRGGMLHVLDAAAGTSLGQRPAPTADLLAGTPGGKYVFAIDSRTGIGEAVDFDDPGRGKPLDLSVAAPVSGWVFSPDGDRLYTITEGTGHLRSFSHRAGELGEFIDIIPGSAASGNPVLNSRGTRAYLNGPDGLEFRLISDGSVLKTVPAASGPMEWVAGPGGRHLWGVSGTGWVAVDEPRARVAASIPASDAIAPRFDPSGRTGWGLADGGRELVVFNVRRPAAVNRIRLAVPATGIAPDGTGGIWISTDTELQHFADVGYARPLSVRSLPGAGEIAAFELVRLKPGQGFACF